MVAPQPFFQARGTPFSILHRIRALVEAGHFVDLITYPIGVVEDAVRMIRPYGAPGWKDKGQGETQIVGIIDAKADRGLF